MTEEYIYAWAYVSCQRVLGEADFLELSELDSEAFEKRLTELGYVGKSVPEMLENELKKAYELALSFAKTPELSGLVTVKNDFHNISAALKCAFSGENPLRLVIKPTKIDIDELIYAAKNDDFKGTDDRLFTIAEDAFRLYKKTADVHSLEVFLQKEQRVYQEELKSRDKTSESDELSVFGFESVLSYLLKKEAEVQNLRTIYYCTRKGLDKAMIKDALRWSYV